MIACDSRPDPTMIHTTRISPSPSRSFLASETCEPSSDPLVSVVIPAYNAENWIGQTLESAAAQSLREIEILVVDDGSADGTAALAENFARRDPRARVIRQHNQGVGAARNAAILAARGTYIAPLDADDLWDPTKLEKQVACMDRFGERVGMVYCDSWLIDEHGTKLEHESEFPCLVGQCRRRLVHYNFLGNASVPLFRAEALRRCGLYLTRQEQDGSQGCEDWDLALRIAEQWDVAPVPERLVAYRQVANCMSGTGEGMSKSFQLVVERARRRNPDLPPDLFSWSEARFQRWIFRKCYRNGDSRASIQAALSAIANDRLMLLDSKLQRMMIKCLLVQAKARLGLTRSGNAPASAGPATSSTRNPLNTSVPISWRTLDRFCIGLQRRIARRRLNELEPESDHGSLEALPARAS
jgi:glycosyltransferase involved in cell wall biosynthesis